MTLAYDASVVPDTISRRCSEKGQTIVLAALAMVTLLVMAALAIDIVALYVARGEVQRAADAAALVAAKAFVDSGVTSDPNNTDRQTLAKNMANAGITGILPQNKVAGLAPVLVGTPTFDFTTYPGNPQVTVTLQRTGLPIFFARIWKTTAPTVTASAKAEAYNPSQSQTSTGSYIPIAPKCVKPLLIPNKNPSSGAPFINVSTGAVAAGLVGQPITLTSGCQSGPPNNPCVPAASATDPAAGNFLPATTVSDSNNLCPSCEGSSAFEQCIECCDMRIYSCGAATSPQPPQPRVDTTITTGDVRSLARNGVKCLINAPSEDTIDVTNLSAGTGPAEITAGSGPYSGSLVSTSQSIATFPIMDTPVPAGGNATVVGFLQAFIDDVNSVGNVSITMHILNVAGCGDNPSTQPVVSGGGYSVIPVRLVSQ